MELLEEWKEEDLLKRKAFSNQPLEDVDLKKHMEQSLRLFLSFMEYSEIDKQSPDLHDSLQQALVRSLRDEN